jgi:hypothetical protein
VKIMGGKGILSRSDEDLLRIPLPQLLKEDWGD